MLRKWYLNSDVAVFGDSFFNTGKYGIPELTLSLANLFNVEQIKCISKGGDQVISLSAKLAEAISL